jgi:hypothetical protein
MRIWCQSAGSRVRMKVAAASNGLAYAARQKTRIWFSWRAAATKRLKQTKPAVQHFNVLRTYMPQSCGLIVK